MSARERIIWVVGAAVMIAGISQMYRLVSPAATAIPSESVSASPSRQTVPHAMHPEVGVFAVQEQQ